MRVSTSQIHQQATAQLSRLGQETSLSQQRIASGQKLLKASDDPVAAAKILELNQDLAVREQYLKNADQAQTQLQAQDSVITQVVESLQRVRELTLQAGDGTLTSQDRSFMAEELDARLGEMRSLLNSRGADGNYLFSGFQGDREPFADIGGQLSFVGDQGQRRVQIDHSSTVALGVSGFRLFEDVGSADIVPWVQTSQTNRSEVDLTAKVIDQEKLTDFSPDNLAVEFFNDDASGDLLFSVTRAGDGRVVDGLERQPFAANLNLESVGLDLRFSGQPSPGDSFLVDSSPSQGLLGTAQEIANKLADPNSATNNSNDLLRGLIDSTLIELDNSLNTMLGVQAELGAEQNRIESTAELHRTVELQGKQALSSLRDVDFAQAVSDLSYQAFLLEAAQQSFVRVNNLSLFNAL